MTKVNISRNVKYRKKFFQERKVRKVPVEKIQIRRDYVLQYMVNNDYSLNQLALEIGVSPATEPRAEWRKTAGAACDR